MRAPPVVDAVADRQGHGFGHLFVGAGAGAGGEERTAAYAPWCILGFVVVGLRLVVLIGVVKPCRRRQQPFRERIVRSFLSCVVSNPSRRVPPPPRPRPRQRPL